jgi:RNA-directed DNA polymerase
MPNTELEITEVGMDDTPQWNQVNSKKLERRVYKLQTRIYRASKRGDVKAVRRLQKTLLHSWSAKLLAVRRVTQDNQGKKTAGVDGVKSHSPKATSRPGRATEVKWKRKTHTQSVDSEPRN